MKPARAELALLAITAVVLLLFVFCSGCVPPPGASLSFDGQEPPPLTDLHVEPPYLVDEATALETGEPAPFDGVLLAPEVGAYCLATEDMLHHCVGAVQDERRARLGDRAESIAIVEARDAYWRGRMKVQREIVGGVCTVGGFVAGVLCTIAITSAVGAN